MKNVIRKDDCRCLGELIGQDWGHADTVCHVREHCARYIQSVMDVGNKTKEENADKRYTGWACATEEKENFITLERLK